MNLIFLFTWVFELMHFIFSQIPFNFLIHFHDPSFRCKIDVTVPCRTNYSRIANASVRSIRFGAECVGPNFASISS